MSVKANTIDADYLRRILDYSPESGIFSWKRRDTVSRCTNTQRVNKIAGWINDAGYIIIEIDGKNYRAHILAWIYVYSCAPNEIDHINGYRADNRFVNLRECTRTQNLGNAKKRRNNTSGFKGVSFNKTQNKWQVRVCYSGKTIHLGFFKSLAAAHNSYLLGAKKYFGDFANGGV